MQTIEVTEMIVQVPGGSLNADLVSPANHEGLVIVPQSNSSRPGDARTARVAHILQEHGLATLTVHLLLPAEAALEVDRGVAIPAGDILSDRLQRACRCARTLGGSRPPPIALCGVGADAGVAVWAAALEFDAVRALATLGGRPDLVPGEVLERVCAPTLFVVSSTDPVVVQFSRDAVRKLHPPSRVAVVDGAMHALAEAQSIDRGARQAALWFRRHLGRLTHRPPIGEEARVE